MGFKVTKIGSQSKGITLNSPLKFLSKWQQNARVDREPALDLTPEKRTVQLGDNHGIFKDSPHFCLLFSTKVKNFFTQFYLVTFLQPGFPHLLTVDQNPVSAGQVLNKIFFPFPENLAVFA